MLFLAIALAVYHYFSWPQFAFDSLVLLRGHIFIRAWWSNGYEPPVPHADTFPPFQHLSAELLLRLFHDDQRAVLRVWCYTSTACFLTMLLLACRTVALRGGRALGWLVLAIILSGPIVAYGGTSFNEIPAGLVTLAFVAAVLSSRPLSAFIFFLLAALTKEVAAPILILIWIACAWRPMMRRPALRTWYFLGALVGTAISYLASAELNLLRFGVPFNRENLMDYRIVATAAQQGLYLLALWFSPSGGLCFFWPLAVAVVLPVLFLGVRSRPHRRELPPALFLVAAGLLLFIGLSRWHQPMGWDAWGPRLLLPWVPAFVVATLSLYPRITRHCARWLLGSRIKFALTCAVVFVSAVPSFLVLSAWQIVAYWFLPDRWVPAIPPPESGNIFYYDVQNYEMWMKHPIMLDVYRHALQHPRAIVQGIIFGSGILAALYVCRLELLRRPTIVTPPTRRQSAG